MGFRIETYAQAKAYGLEHLWTDDCPKIALPEAAPPPSRFVSDGMNKLERAFWDRICFERQSGGFAAVYREPMTLRLAGRTTWKPDFLSINHMHSLTFWETKGFMRQHAAVKIKVAAETYPEFRFVLVTKARLKTFWECRIVDCNGISREIFCPNWLK